MVVILILNPAVAVIILPLVVVLYMVRRYYLHSQRQTERLMSAGDYIFLCLAMFAELLSLCRKCCGFVKERLYIKKWWLLYFTYWTTFCTTLQLVVNSPCQSSGFIQILIANSMVKSKSNSNCVTCPSSYKNYPGKISLFRFPRTQSGELYYCTQPL